MSFQLGQLQGDTPQGLNSLPVIGNPVVVHAFGEDEKEILAGMDELTGVVLQFGAAGRLMMTKELAVMPLENAALEKKTNPYSPDGKFRIDPAKVAVRDSAMVKIAMRKTNAAVIILGGSHDLSAAVRSFSKDCEYFRVTTRGYPE